MANTFKSLLQKDVGTSLTQIDAYTVPASTTTIAIGLTVCNTTATEITVDVLVRSLSTDYYIVKTQTIPANETLVLAGGDQKIVLSAGAALYAKSSVSASIDVVASIMETA